MQVYKNTLHAVLLEHRAEVPRGASAGGRPLAVTKG